MKFGGSALQKERIDTLLVTRGYFESREKARASIMAGQVFANREKSDKAGTKYLIDCDIEIKGSLNPYASRGGLKLEKALDTFQTNVLGAIAMDVGASTGGFTDCMLQKGAVKVYAVDVGYGQLAWHLRSDNRVVCMERTNIRYVNQEDIPDKLDFVTIDVAFISLSKVLPKVFELMKESAELICLIKPQFEAGREKVGKKGVVRDSNVHIEVIEGVFKSAKNLGFNVLGLSFSPIKGPEGNIEFLAWMKKEQVNNIEMVQLDYKSDYELIRSTVASAHGEL